MVDPDDVRSFLERNPEVENDLREILAVDENGSWEFRDISVDSGSFGEIVSAGIVEKEDGRYRVADRTAVRRALNGERTDRSSVIGTDGLSLARPSVNVHLVALLGAALSLVVLFRVLSFPAVFRGTDIVLSGNDPYAYRYYVEQLVLTGAPRPSAVGELEGQTTLGEPLLVFTLGLAAELLGGGQRAVGLVLAWYPVVAAAITGGLVYFVAETATDDWRVGIAAVVMLAIVPVHAFRASLGFADHHAFDYLWLAVTILALVRLIAASTLDGRTVGWTLVLSLGVAGQVLAWNAGPLFLVPPALFASLYAVSAVRRDGSPAVPGLPIVVGFGLGAIGALGVHLLVGWQSRGVAFAPLALLAWIATAFGFAEVGSRRAVSARTMTIGQIGFAAVLAAAIVVFLPETVAELEAGVRFLTGMGGIVETEPLVGETYGTVVGPLFFFGFVFLLGFGYLVWASYRAYQSHEPVWLALACYGWWFLAFALAQVRFAGEISVVVAVFAGLGFVHLLSQLGVASSPEPFRTTDGRRKTERASRGRPRSLSVPDRTTAFTLVAVFLLVGSVSFVQIPIKTGQLTVDDGTYATATWIENDAERQGLEYPENYVLSSWGQNRVYNYFVNGESRTYGYANQNYRSFVTASNATEWYHRFDGRVGYVVVDGNEGGSSGTVYDRLYNHHGSATEDTDGVAHYRLVYVGGESQKVFQVVDGATIIGTTSPDQTVTVSTEVAVSGETFTYERTVTADDDGRYEVVVPYPGEYEVDDGSVTVSESAVVTGETVNSSTGGGGGE